MLMESKKASKISFEELFFSSWTMYVKSFKKILILLLYSLIAVIILSILGLAWSYLKRYIWVTTTPAHYLILLYNIFAQFFAYLLFIILGSIFQILLINILINPKIKLLDNIKLIKKYLLQFLVLSIIFILATLVAFSPLFVFAGLTLTNAPNVLFLAAILFALAIVLAAIITVNLGFSPFILIDKNVSAIKAIKINKTIAKNKFFKILGFILLLWLIMGLISSINSFINTVPVANLIFNLVYLIFALPFVFVYLFNLYKITDR